ncbi:NACHT domain-containing protein [Egbenema bharatensis]|uniref:NACHT domain-containing protein n=1 Tax=Egbenema bharatensis TaxID=3463334 RepID=UPI003A89FF44
MPPSHLRYRKTVILTPQGWQKLEAAKLKLQFSTHSTKASTLEALSEATGLSPHTLSKIHNRKAGVDLRSLIRYFNALNLTLEPNDYFQPVKRETTQSVSPEGLNDGCVVELPPLPSSPSWGLAPDVSRFYGRTAELDTLQQWISQDRCRIVTLLGMGGIGKTWAATKLTEQLLQEFNIVIWRSLRSMPPHPPLSFSELADDLLQHFPSPPKLNLLNTSHAKMLYLLDSLSRDRCLLVLDNFDAILQGCPPQTASGSGVTEYRSGYEAYGEFLQQVGKGRHQSCLLLTSREEPKQIQQLSGDNACVRVLPLPGLQVAEIQQIISSRGIFQGTPADWMQLVNYYQGNPLLLETVATTVQRLFAGNLTAFLRQNTLICENVRELLDQQLEGLIASAQAVIHLLVAQPTPLSFTDLQSRLSTTFTTTDLIQSLKLLKARSLVEQTDSQFFLQPLLRDYLRTSIQIGSHRVREQAPANTLQLFTSPPSFPRLIPEERSSLTHPPPTTPTSTESCDTAC